MIKKALGILFALSFIMFGLFTSCVRTQHLRISLPPSNWECPARTISVRIDSRFSFHDHKIIVSALPLLEKLKVTAVVDEDHPELTIKYWNHDCSDRILGQYAYGTDYVLVDADCSITNQRLRAVVVHEIGHWLGMEHVCKPDLKTTDKCSSIGVGEATMNPYLDVYKINNISDLDMVEYRKACWKSGY